jgi:hypothetical protein
MNYISKIFSKYLDELYSEISNYESDKILWEIREDINNPPGNLALHICGNLKHNIYHIIGGKEFQRQRDLEFSNKDLPKHEILNEIQETKRLIMPILENLNNEDLTNKLNDESLKSEETINDALFRIAFHLAYHLGQINYHRRIAAK